MPQTSLTTSRLKVLLDRAKGKRVAVVGDFMLDRHLKGSVRRISPEAPVPVVEIDTEVSGLGGAGNVVSNLAGLLVDTIAFGVIGEDRTGELLAAHLKECRCETSGLILSKNRKTSEKIRVIAHDQHVVRVDRETNSSISASDETKLLDALQKNIGNLDAIILQDYNKGVLTERVIKAVITMARDSAVQVSVDPKFENFFAFVGAHLFKPNVREVERALGVSAESDAKLREAGALLLEKLNPDFLMITRGEKGMALFNRRGELTQIPTRARKVHDVSGAGDTVISTFVTAEMGGATAEEAAIAANFAAGIVCGQVGVVPIERNQLVDEFAAEESGATSSAG